MGAELSSIRAPLSVNFELTIGEEELDKVREFWDHTVNNREHEDGERAERQEHANRQAGARDMGSTGNATSTGGAGVTRAGGAVSTAGGAMARAGGIGGHRRDMDSAGCSSDNTGPIRTRNVKFTKSGRFCKGHTGRRYDKSHGFITPATKASETKTTETITITDMESSDEEVEWMEKRLAKLLELKYKRRNLDN